MKRLGLVVVMVMVVAISSCGGSSGSTPTTTQGILNAAMSSFFGVVDYIDDNWDQVCTAKAIFDCDCPGGGSVDVDETEFDATMTGCKSSDGQTFSGTLDADNATESITLDLNPAGGCTSIAGTLTDTGDTTPNCSGTLTYNCNGETGTCDVSSNCQQCTIN